jgi:hypothetical protein
MNANIIPEDSTATIYVPKAPNFNPIESKGSSIFWAKT